MVILTAFLSILVVESELLAVLRLVLLASSPPSGDNNFITFESKVHETFYYISIVIESSLALHTQFVLVMDHCPRLMNV